MKEHHDGSGRWVIRLDEGPPLFWSLMREDLEGVCAILRRTCPTARVIWMEDTEVRGDTQEPHAPTK